MADRHEDWGLCKDCKWWQIEPDADMITDETLGLCIERELKPYQVRVSAQSGCNRFEPGTHPRKEGASQVPAGAGSSRH